MGEIGWYFLLFFMFTMMGFFLGWLACGLCFMAEDHAEDERDGGRGLQRPADIQGLDKDLSGNEIKPHTDHTPVVVAEIMEAKKSATRTNRNGEVKEK